MAGKFKPTILKELAGSYEKDPQRRNTREPKARRGKPVRPKHIQGIAKTEWNRICDLLDQSKVLTLDCGPALEQYCVQYLRWRTALKRLLSGEASRTDSVDFRESSQFCHRWLCEFGLTPASRTRIQIQEETDSVNEFEEKYLA